MFWFWRSAREHERQARFEGRPRAIAELTPDFVGFDQGVRLVYPIPLIHLERSPGSDGPLTDNLIAPGTTGLVMSSRLRRLLVDAGVSNLQVFPMSIARRTGTENDYALVNVIGAIECIDLERSAVELDAVTRRIEWIERLVLREDLASAPMMFRAAEFTQLLVVREAVRDVCVAKGVTGVQFVRPEAFAH